MMETSIIRFSILDFGFWIGEAESEGEGREIGACGLAAGARNSRTKRKEEEAQEHPGEEERPVENTRRPSVVKAPVVDGVAVIDRKKTRVTHGRRSRGVLGTRSCGSPGPRRRPARPQTGCSCRNPHTAGGGARGCSEQESPRGAARARRKRGSEAGAIET